MLLTDEKLTIVEQFRNSTLLVPLAYLAATLRHVTALNKELQLKEIKLILAGENISAFISKLQYWNQKVNANKVPAFPNLGVFGRLGRLQS